jgi:hypothetical protein
MLSDDAEALGLTDAALVLEFAMMCMKRRTKTHKDTGQLFFVTAMNWR